MIKIDIIRYPISISQLIMIYKLSSYFLSSVGVTDNKALTRLLQASFLFFVASQILVVFDGFLLQVLPDIVHPDFVL